MSNVTQKIYKDFTDGLGIAPGPDAPTFFEAWEAYTSVVNLVGSKLLLKSMGKQIDAANEVRLYLERHHKISRITEDMPLLVPAPAFRAISVWGKFYDTNHQIGEYLQFLVLAPAIADAFTVYATKKLGQFSMPVVNALTTAAKSATIMQDCVQAELEAYMLKGM